MGAEAKLSVTVERDLVREVDELAGARTRSSIVEEALRRWTEEARRAALEAETRAYSEGLTEEDRSEDPEWAELGARSAREIW